jgi:8-oxo-dGTP pyrophosphatase MutT (NUDIX family)
LTLRPTTLQHHGGQVCLPGGRIEAGENARQAAVREFEEELGTDASHAEHCGELSTQYVYASDNLVHPVIFLLDKIKRPLVPDPVEVAEVIPLPLSELAKPERIEFFRARAVRQGDCDVGQLKFRARAFRYADHNIWGATAMILEDLARLLHLDA